VHPGLCDHAQGPFGADQEPGQVPLPLGPKLLLAPPDVLHAPGRLEPGAALGQEL